MTAEMRQKVGALIGLADPRSSRGSAPRRGRVRNVLPVRFMARLTWSGIGVAHEAAGWRDVVGRACARDAPAPWTVIQETDRHGRGQGRRRLISRATLRVGDVPLKVDVDQARIGVEVQAMALRRSAPEGPGAQAACVRDRRGPGAGARPPRRAVDRASGEAGRSGCRHRDVARRAAAAPAGASASRRRISTASASGLCPTARCPPTWSPVTARSPRPLAGRGLRC